MAFVSLNEKVCLLKYIFDIGVTTPNRSRCESPVLHLSGTFKQHIGETWTRLLSKGRKLHTGDICLIEMSITAIIFSTRPSKIDLIHGLEQDIKPWDLFPLICY